MFTQDEINSLTLDIRHSEEMRAKIRERLAAHEDFDLVAAWEELEVLDNSIRKRIVELRQTRGNEGPDKEPGFGQGA